MEGFWQVLDEIHKSAVFQKFFLFDWAILVVVLWGISRGSRKGFSEMFGKCVGIFLVAMLTLTLYLHLAGFFSADVLMIPKYVAEPAAFFLTGVFLWIVISWFLNTLGKVFKLEVQGFLKIVGGMILGGVHMVLLLSFLAYFFQFFPSDQIKKSLNTGENRTGEVIARLVPELHQKITAPFLKPDEKNSALSPATSG